jgi:isopenicillin N synthase-like dioxygenase
LPQGQFDAAYAEPKCNLRLAYYPPQDPDVSKRPGGQRYGAHTDYTGFTILRPDPSVSGLELQLASGEWIKVPPQPDALVVNAGDLIQVWTNDRWRSPPHRVVNPPGGAKPCSRLSLVFFTGPANDTIIEALPGCHGPDRPKRYDPVTSGEHLQRKLTRSNV